MRSAKRADVLSFIKVDEEKIHRDGFKVLFKKTTIIFGRALPPKKYRKHRKVSVFISVLSSTPREQYYKKKLRVKITENWFISNFYSYCIIFLYVHTVFLAFTSNEYKAYFFQPILRIRYLFEMPVLASIQSRYEVTRVKTAGPPISQL